MYQILVSGTTIGLFLQVVPITVVLGASYLILRLIYLQKKQIPIKWSLEIVRTLFICYLTGLANLILVPRNFWSGIWANIFVGYSGSEIELFDGTFNFTPIVFKVISGELTLGSWVKTMLAGNFLMFIPMGFFLPLAASKMDFKKILKIAIVVPIIVEIIQPIVGRSFDIDDIILNFAGIMIGYLFVVCIIKLSKKRLFGK